MYKFRIVYTENIFRSEILYDDNEYSLRPEPWISSDITFVVGQYIQLGISSYNMVVRLFSGLSPFNSWAKKRLNTPVFEKGILILQANVESSTAIQLEDTENWESKFDITTGWLCIGNDAFDPDDKAVQFLINAAVVVDKGFHLKSLWCKPIFRKEFGLLIKSY
jgi:hypothetical protein